MALLHKAELRPTKLEWLATWLPTLPWYEGTAAPDLKRVAAYRFDDPAGRVGIETMLVRADGGPLIQVPMTYHEAPLEGADDWLICTAEHSVLGRRWIYDGCGDPLYATMLAHMILTGVGQADEFIELDGVMHKRERSMSLTGSGTLTKAPVIETLITVGKDAPTVIVTGPLQLTVARILDATSPEPAPGDTLTGVWEGQPAPVTLAAAQMFT